MTEPHPFARFINILGRGKTLTRALTIEEAEEAFGFILDGKVLPEQLGAFMMLLRVKEEVGAEIAGFTRAVRARLAAPAGAADVDWPSYAGKKRQQLWYLLAALCMARSGVRVFMHGTEGHTPGRVYTREVLGRLGVPLAGSLTEAAEHLKARNFAYAPLETFSPRLHALFGLKAILGLRSVAHTLARQINPMGAPATLQGIFHPGYMAIHLDAGLLLGDARLAVFRGEGGEVERRPNKPCEVWSIANGEKLVERWAPLLPEPVQEAQEDMDPARLVAVWRGEQADEYGEAAVIGTIAIALRTMGKAGTMAEAQTMAGVMWSARDRSQLLAAA